MSLLKDLEIRNMCTLTNRKTSTAQLKKTMSHHPIQLTYSSQAAPALSLIKVCFPANLKANPL